MAALRTGWKLHVKFGLTHPELYLLMYADPPRQTRSAQRLIHHMQQAAATGRLRGGEEIAAHLFLAAACGTVMILLGMPGAQQDMSLLNKACDAALAAIVTDKPLVPAPTVAAPAAML